MELVNSSIHPTRVVAWDLLKLFAILLVVYGHCMQHLLEVDVTHNPMFLWISSFHMPLFMALSGLFARRAYQGSFKDFLVKRGRQVLLPCLSWSLIIYIVLAFLDRDIHIHGIRSFADVHDTYSLSLAKWGQYTLGVYVIQSLLLETLLVRWVSFGADTLVLFDMLIGPLLTLLVVVICLWVNYLIILMGRGKISLLLLGRDYSQDAR